MGMFNTLQAAGGKYEGNYSGTFSSKKTDDNGIWIALISSSGEAYFLIGSHNTGNVGVTKEKISEDGYFEGETRINNYTIHFSIKSGSVVEGEWKLCDLDHGKLKGKLNSSQRVRNYSGNYIDRDAKRIAIIVESNGYIDDSNSIIVPDIKLEGVVDGSGNMILHAKGDLGSSGYIGKIEDNGNFEIYNRSGNVWISGYKPLAHIDDDDDDDVCFISTIKK